MQNTICQNLANELEKGDLTVIKTPTKARYKLARRLKKASLATLLKPFFYYQVKRLKLDPKDEYFIYWGIVHQLHQLESEVEPCK